MCDQIHTTICPEVPLSEGPHELPQGFPEQWLVPADQTKVISPVHWNREPLPAAVAEESHFSVAWGRFYGTNLLRTLNYDVEPFALIMRLYFGLQGCIIPVAFPRARRCHVRFYHRWSRGRRRQEEISPPLPRPVLGIEQALPFRPPVRWC
ncbi:hypothetical protein B0H12DRAFT_264154 [Mycena haematopus]|nr:hypothetical protein B0H12DRAFT_264154 [Mycena haematopus]